MKKIYSGFLILALIYISTVYSCADAVSPAGLIVFGVGFLAMAAGVIALIIFAVIRIIKIRKKNKE